MNINRLNFVRPENELRIGEIVYWMSRDQRIDSNWAFSYAQQIAIERKKPLRVLFVVNPTFLEATFRQYYFMIEGLKEVEERLKTLNIPFTLLLGDVSTTVSKYLNNNSMALLITDFDPLLVKRSWKEYVKNNTSIPIVEVDAHNIVPCKVVSTKAEFAAYTIRPKIKRLLPEYFELPPTPEFHSFNSDYNPSNQLIDWDSVYSSLSVNMNVRPSIEYIPGRKVGLKTLEYFIQQKIESYIYHRNDPTKGMISGLSPYLHFGQISAVECAFMAKNVETQFQDSVTSFLEELIVRRELSDNYCYYNANYNSFEGYPDWAKKTLNEHKSDKREFLYTLEEFENIVTHDPLWNAAQKEMVRTGKMHGYMRMYWAKKILEWTTSPEEAHTIALYLNDTYQLDGRDPNGYVGIAWSIGGVHDRAWFERPIYGKIRYMNYNGCASKFDVKKYIKMQNNEQLF